MLLDALRAIPARQRACLILRFWEDCSVTETARTLGCREGTVKSQTARGLHTLRALLEDMETERESQSGPRILDGVARGSA
jgi:RNA polymerase sigma factor (sigma-70 family)